MSRRHLLGLAAAVVAGCGHMAARRLASAPGAAQTPVPSGSLGGRIATTAPSGVGARTVPASSATERPAVEVVRGLGARPEVALTFHGAGDPSLTRALVQVLAHHRANVTVLGVGGWLAANPALVRDLIAAGHELGNHTWSHPVLADLGETDVRAEITRCRDVLSRLVGTPGRFFRPSGGAHSTALIRRVAGSVGYSVCLGYDIDSLDWTDPGAAVIRRNLAAASGGSIVSLHLGHRGTVEAMPHILDDLARRGLRPVTASELLR